MRNASNDPPTESLRVGLWSMCVPRVVPDAIDFLFYWVFTEFLPVFVMCDGPSSIYRRHHRREFCFFFAFILVSLFRLSLSFSWNENLISVPSFWSLMIFLLVPSCARIWFGPSGTDRRLRIFCFFFFFFFFFSFTFFFEVDSRVFLVLLFLWISFGVFSFATRSNNNNNSNNNINDNNFHTFPYRIT